MSCHARQDRGRCWQQQQPVEYQKYLCWSRHVERAYEQNDDVYLRTGERSRSSQRRRLENEAAEGRRRGQVDKRGQHGRTDRSRGRRVAAFGCRQTRTAARLAVS